MLNELNSHLRAALTEHVATKRRLNTFNIQTDKSPRPSKKWSLNTSFEPAYFDEIAPQRKKDLATIAKANS
jgi:hypothetical protein